MKATEIGGGIELGARGEPWCLMHAAGAGPRSLRSLGKVLATSNRHVLIPELYPSPSDDVPVHAYARLAARLFERAPGGLFGHSMGGLSALLAAINGARLRRLILYEPIVLSLLDPFNAAESDAYEWDAKVVRTLNESVLSGQPEKGVACFVDAWSETRWEDLSAAMRAHLVASADTLARETRATSSVLLANAQLRAMSVPTLILQGSKSPAITQHMSARLAQILPNAEMRQVDGAGHMGPVLMGGQIAHLIDAT